MCTRISLASHPTGMRFGLSLLLAVTLPLGAQTSAELAKAFTRLDQTAQQFRSVTADFKRNVHTAVINDDARDMGSIKVRREKSHDTRMLIEFTAPDVKSVALDGTKLRVYTPKLKSVQIYDIAGKRNLVDQFLLLGFGASSTELKELYDVSLLGEETLGTDNTWHLQLIPKSADALKNLKKAELWIIQSSGQPAQQKFITSSTGDFMLVTYSNMQPNKPLSDKDLKLNYPRGVTEESPRL